MREKKARARRTAAEQREAAEVKKTASLSAYVDALFAKIPIHDREAFARAYNQANAPRLLENASTVQTRDNWRDRSTHECGTCMWFIEKASILGRCRRRAPELGGWPAVYVTDFCGDHKLDAAKLPQEIPF